MSSTAKRFQQFINIDPFPVWTERTSPPVFFFLIHSKTKFNIVAIAQDRADTVDGQVAYVIMGQKEIAEKDITYEDIHCISTILRDCDDIELGFTMYEEEENGWRCSFRSDGKWINVNELLKPFGGGGHISAAGLKYRTDNVEELKKQILDRVAEMKKKQ